MNSIAIFIMVSAMGTVTAATIYFFYKVLTAPPKPEPDSYSENDDLPRD
jgi:hypothetical protein